ncbi:UNVERIFIED_CONTAM: hypothetical protein GTU68_041289 [Idotea baltica]|nr:hypothetical protein [Idotea baltica]
MSFEGWGDQQFGGGFEDQKSYSYDMNSGFGQDQQFQSFDYSTQQNAQTSDPSYGSSHKSIYNAQVPQQQQNYFVPGPTLMTPDPCHDSVSHEALGTTMDDEPPLLEELGIDPDAILQKTLNVLNPLRHTDPSILQDTDLAGPLAFLLAFGSFLLLSGKIHFGYIYGIGLLGCLGLYGLLNLMSLQGASLGVVVSVLGYCLLPMVGLAGLNVLMSLQGTLGTILTSASILWCSWSASKLFVTAFEMHHQQPLVAYPCALFYAIFALITIF